MVLQLLLKYAAYHLSASIIDYNATHPATAAASLVGNSEFAQLTIMLTISPQPKHLVPSDFSLETWTRK
jgi:hypothetical protein